MCYFIYIASPLTLSEIRSMLPLGLTADLATYADRRVLKTLHPLAQTVAKLLVGRCSCDLVRQRLADRRQDERHLRERYRALDLPRAMVIQSLERHRSGKVEPRLQPSRESFTRFVIEHARNAGPTLYFLGFGSLDRVAPDPDERRHFIAASEVPLNPDSWLRETTPTLVH